MADDEYCCFVSALAVERRIDGAKDREAALAIAVTAILKVLVIVSVRVLVTVSEE